MKSLLNLINGQACENEQELRQMNLKLIDLNTQIISFIWDNSNSTASANLVKSFPDLKIHRHLPWLQNHSYFLMSLRARS
ncbi:hypothetical protein BpHYR1_045432 [Brachionus plicatilis]|uniref:Uncharacterized protein n=1 Tax=Brachionus plicatilis TaxID=10195 RepID=A0A3M7PKA0_BRAPC|nr:hypothetical protein BpHYR1_045432 [Brachionus plicatilis]